MGKYEIYKNSEGLEYVNANLKYTEFSRFLYDEEFMIKTLKSTLKLRLDKQEDFELIIKEFKRQINL